MPTSRGADHGNDENDSMAKMKAAEEALEAKKKEQPSFELLGKLAAETKRVRGVILLFNEPPDARKPDLSWWLYAFKNDPLYIHSPFWEGKKGGRCSDRPPLLQQATCCHTISAS